MREIFREMYLTHREVSGDYSGWWFELVNSAVLMRKIATLVLH